MAKRSKENIDPDLDDFNVKKQKKLAPNNRFNVSSHHEEIDMITKGCVPMNTQRSIYGLVYESVPGVEVF